MPRRITDYYHYYANPHRFMGLAHALHAPLWLIALGVIGLGLYMSFAAPEDYQQGRTVRIMFIHVPSAWLSLFIYSFMAGASGWALVFRHPLAHIAARAAAPIGACFTLAMLISGSLWGKPMWGAWWVWDARLTSALILLFIYLGYIAVWQMIDDPLRAAPIAAIVALVGAVNVPIVKFSVDWWNSLHQPASILRAGGPSIHPDLLYPLLVMGGGFFILFFALLLTRMQMEILRQRVRVQPMKGQS